MRQLGWVEGRDYVLHDVIYEGRAERIPAAAADLMTRKPDLLVGSGTPPMEALTAAPRRSGSTCSPSAIPVGQGFVHDGHCALGRDGDTGAELFQGVFAIDALRAASDGPAQRAA